MSEPNPCLDCGVCCAHFRVSFYWAEADDSPGGHVPVAMTEHLQQHWRCMKGTNAPKPRCAALLGEIGQGVRCTIYAERPSPCREFPVYLQDGAPNEACQRLRAGIGLLPLLPLVREHPLKPVQPAPQPDLPQAA